MLILYFLSYYLIMINKQNLEKKSGFYFGTEIKEKWWNRYTKDGMFSRGKGQYWFDNDSFYFLKDATSSTIQILRKDIITIKIGKWHSGKWGVGKPVVKILWLKENRILSSGFLVSKNIEEVEQLITELGF